MRSDELCEIEREISNEGEEKTVYERHENLLTPIILAYICT